jgi:hypothetical protein
MSIAARRMTMTTITFLISIALPAVLGCGANQTNLPDTVVIELPDGTQTEVTLGSGVISLADTSWQFFSTGAAAQSAPFVTISFGPNGELETFEDNTFSPEIFGSTIFFDGTRHDTNQPGLSYAAATFGAETSDASGFSFVAHLNAFFAGLQVANAIATATGSLDPDNPAVMTGTFEFNTTIEVDLPGVPPGDQTLNLDFRAARVDN